MGPDTVTVHFETSEDIVEASLVGVLGSQLSKAIRATHVKRSDVKTSADFVGWHVCRFLRNGSSFHRENTRSSRSDLVRLHHTPMAGAPNRRGR